MAIRNVMVLVVDGWGAPWLGPYGNTWVETAALNRLAAESFLCEHAIIDSPDLATVYRSYWRGAHAACRDAVADRFPPLAEVLEEAGVATALVTDEPAILGHPQAAAFGDRWPVPMSAAEMPVEALHETQLARLFATAADRLAHQAEPFLLWVHAQGMLAPWDAPLELRNQFAGEDDPLPPEFSDVPCLLLPKDYDPDELLGLTHAYAGQVALLDACLGGLLASLAENPVGEELACFVTSPRGFPVGEHRRVGYWDGALYGEVTQVPWLMRLPGLDAAAARCQALVQPADLYPTLLDAFGVSAEASAGGTSLLPLVRGEVDRVRDRACVVADEQQGIRTRAWYFCRGARDEIFAKPDDRWETNEVLDRCGDVPEKMAGALEDFRAAAGTGDFSELPALPAELEEGME